MEASPLFYSIKAMNKSADGRRCKLFMYLPNHQRMAGTWCRWIWGPRCRVYQREQPASSSVHSRSARNHKDSTRLSVNKTPSYISSAWSPTNVRWHYLDLLINLFEHGWNDKRSLHSLDFLSSGPDVPEENLSACRVDRYSGTEKERGQQSEGFF